VVWGGMPDYAAGEAAPFRAGPRRLRLHPYGVPLTGHTGAVRWGGWVQRAGRLMLATGGDDGTARVWLWDPGSQTPLPLWLDCTTPLLWGRWGQVDGYLATGGEDGAVWLWNPANGHRIPLRGHIGPVLWGRWGQAGGRAVLASGGRDGTVRLWDPASQAPLGPPDRGVQVGPGDSGGNGSATTG
jgi:WD40 repeat protein